MAGKMTRPQGWFASRSTDTDGTSPMATSSPTDDIKLKATLSVDTITDSIRTEGSLLDFMIQPAIVIDPDNDPEPKLNPIKQVLKKVTTVVETKLDSIKQVTKNPMKDVKRAVSRLSLSLSSVKTEQSSGKQRQEKNPAEDVKKTASICTIIVDDDEQDSRNEGKKNSVKNWMEAVYNRRPTGNISFSISKDMIKVPFKYPSCTSTNVLFLALNIVLASFSYVTFIKGLMATSDPNTLGLAAWDPTGRLDNVDMYPVVYGISVTMIVCGLFFFSVGCLGFFACMLSHVRMLKLYAALFGTVAGLLVCAFFYVVWSRQSLRDLAKDKMISSLHESYEGTQNSTKLFSQFMDVMQVFLGCCGLGSWRDFEATPWYRKTNSLGGNCSGNESSLDASSDGGAVKCSGFVLRLFPKSCCRTSTDQLMTLVDRSSVSLEDEDCPKKPVGRKNLNTGTPCISALYAWVLGQVGLI